MSNPVYFLLQPVDTLFFRTARPFNQSDPGAAAAESIFPPYPRTVAGCLRAALARLLGWSGHGGWPEQVKAVLGDGEDLEKLKFFGPYLMRSKVQRKGPPMWERLYPPPACLVARDGLADIRRLAPRRDIRLKTDLDDVPLPALATPDKKFSPLQSHWLTPQGMAVVLNGNVPKAEQFIKAVSTDPEDEEPSLWSVEEKVGIGRNNMTRRVLDGALYMAAHIRMQPDVALCMGVDGLNDAMRKRLEKIRDKKDGDLGVVPLGGEHRGVSLRLAPSTFAKTEAVPPCPDKENSGRARIAVALTPVLGAEALIKSDAVLVDQTVRAISAGKALQIGGWSGAGADKRRPVPQRPALPAGTTWHLAEGAEAEPLIRKGEKNVIRVGEEPAWGYGEVALGWDAV